MFYIFSFYLSDCFLILYCFCWLFLSLCWEREDCIYGNCIWKMYNS